jgi:WD40 repeat protein
MDTYKLNRTLCDKGHDGQITAVSFSPDGKYFVTGGKDGKVKIWDVVTGDVLYTFTCFKFNSSSVEKYEKVCSVLFSPDGTEIIAATENVSRESNLAPKHYYREDYHEVDDSVCVSWNLLYDKQTRWGKGARCIVYNHTGTLIACAERDNISIYDAKTKEPIYADNNEESAYYPVVIKFTPDGSQIIACNSLSVDIIDVKSMTGIYSTYDYENDTNIYPNFDLKYDDGTHSIKDMDISPDGKRIVLFNWAINCEYMELRSMLPEFILLHKVEFDVEYPKSVQFSPDGRQIVSCGEQIIIWDAETLDQLSNLNIPLFPGIREYSCSAFNNDGSKLVTVGPDIKIWDSRDWETMRAIDDRLQKVNPGIPHEIAGEIASYTSKSNVPEQFVKRSTGNLSLYPAGKGGKRRTTKRKQTKKKTIKRKHSVRSKQKII